ncbi:MAG TPA: RHS repeat-associated core domain-containing protein [Candidatus Limnocylindrales bacterium]
MAKRMFTAAVSVFLAVTMLGQAAYAIPWAGEWQPPAPPQIAGVKVTNLPTGTAMTAGSRDKVVTAPRGVSWPAAGKARVAVPQAGAHAPALARAEGTPVHIGAPNAMAAFAPAAVRVQVADRQATAAAGVFGVLLAVTRDDPGTAIEPGLGAAETAVTVEVDYSAFAGAASADWASRLRLVALPGCLIADRDIAGKCGAPVPLASTNDPRTRKVSATVPLSGSETTTLSLSAAPAGANGDYTATSLSPAGAWQVSAQTGGFSWSYALRMVPGVTGPSPSLSMSYSSQAVDGRTGNTNNQGSWIGDGWDMWPGYVERQYQTCSQDMDPIGGQSPNNPYASGDSCWFSDNATLSLNGRSTELVKTATGKWVGVSDDGSRIERLNDTGLGNGDFDGESWKVTTTEGTQYFFGRNRRAGYPTDTAETRSTWTAPVYGNHPGEPGFVSGNFLASRQTQAWRWNLDYVIDPQGNTMTLFYGKETGAYAREAYPDRRTTYDRGGYLTRIDYGTRQGSEHTATVPARVVFDVADRCLPNVPCDFAHPQSWPDAPVDQYCAAQPCMDQMSPTFWTQKRLAKVRAQVWRNGAFTDAESWTLRHEYLDAGASDGEGVPMWLSGITRTGHVTAAGGAAASDPEVTFDPGPHPLANRVDGPDDGKTQLNRWRMNRVWTEAGSIIIINYKAPECTGGSLPLPETNAKRCYPQWYGPNGMKPTLDWFHKHVVESVFVDDTTGGSPRMETHYDYLDSPAWAYAESELVKPDKRTWSQWRGYSKVRIRQGDPVGTQKAVDYLYLRGIDGDRAAPAGGEKRVEVVDSQGTSIVDHEAHAGFLREQVTTNGSGGPALSGTISTPWRRQIAASGILTAWQTQTESTRAYTVLAGGQKRWTRTVSSFDPVDGMVSQVDNLGNEATDDDDTCARSEYARNTDTWILDKVSRSTTYAMKCASVPATPGPNDVLGDDRTFYDNPDTFGAAPTRGLAVKNQTLGSWNGTTPVWVTTGRTTYDAHGRAVEVFDALNRKTTTAYTPQTGGPVTANAVTNALGHTITTTFEPAWGTPVKITDQNERVTDLAYDGLGRLEKVWLPGRDKATQTPNRSYEYLVRRTAPTAVTTRSLLPLGNTFETSIVLYDGSLRQRQIQAQAPGGGRTVTDTAYDSLGQVAWQSKPYYDASNTPPSADLVGTNQPQIPAITENVYDGAGRVTASVFKALGVEKWRTTAGYGGDRVHVTPPAGGTATTTISDAQGRTVALRQYHGPTPAGAYDETTYRYTREGQLERLTDPAGNVWSWGYDVRGRQKSETDPDSGTSTTTYDDANQVKITIDGRGAALGYTYDDLGRKTSVREGSPTGVKRAEWVYDAVAGGLGMIARSARYDNGHAYTNDVLGYHPAGQPSATRVTIPESEAGLAGTYDTTTTFHPDGSVYTMTLPAAAGNAAETLVFAYNDVGMQTEIVSAESIYVYSAAYDKLGQLTQRVLGNFGKRTAITYGIDEPTGRLANTSAVVENGSEAMDLAYKYDPTGNLVRIADSAGSTLPSDTQCFRYDHLRRLAKAWTPSAKTETNCDPDPQFLGGTAKYRQDFTYDPAGNRTKMTEYTSSTPLATTTYTYPAPASPQPHTLRSATRTEGTAQTVSTYGYDDAGNTTRRVAGGRDQTLGWDPEGRVRQISEAAGNTSFVYDADGNRLIRRDPGGATLYLAGQEVRYKKGTGVATCIRYYTHLDANVAVREGSTLNWTVADHHGTGEAMIRDSDMNVSRKRSLPFGGTRGAPPAAWAGDKGFVGGTEDPTDLVHLGARLYDQRTGRFVSDDPVSDTTDPQQLNGYAYANNNPTSFSDPSGLYFTEDNEDTGARAFVLPSGEIRIIDKFVPPPCDAKCQALRDKLRREDRERRERERQEREARARCQADFWCRTGKAMSNAWDTTVKVAKAAYDWTMEHRGTIATIIATALCFVPAVGWAACAGLQAAAFAVRTQQKVADQGGWEKNKNDILLDGVITAGTLGTGAAFRMAQFGKLGGVKGAPTIPLPGWISKSSKAAMEKVQTPLWNGLGFKATVTKAISWSIPIQAAKREDLINRYALGVT